QTTTPDDATTLQTVDDADLVATLPLSLNGSPADTRSGTIIGTPAYMAPEQSRGETELLDQRSDIYSLGAILYLLLSRRPPYDSGDEMTRATGGREASGRHPTRPRQIDPKIPRAIEAVCLKAKSENREERYA